MTNNKFYFVRKVSLEEDIPQKEKVPNQRNSDDLTSKIYSATS